MGVNRNGGAFGARLLGTALVVILDPTDFGDERPGGFSLIIVEKSKLTTKAVPNARAPKAVATLGP
ncbi:MAG TPA: hypothetical protein VFY40_18845 [Blastocatellia bacterium]|nr:hypothetical protein [Blastocatellia bacterium]